jgi:glycosyltransferase involved in cell wall biosynthesis
MRIAIFHELPSTTGSRKSIGKIAEYLSKNHKLDLYYTDVKPTYKNGPYKKIFFYKFVPVVWQGNNSTARLYRDTIELVKLFLLHYKISREIKEKRYDAVFIHGSYLTESPFLLLFKNHFKIYYAHAPNYTRVFEKVLGIPKKDRARYLYEILNRFIRKIIDKANVRSSDLILANSKYTKREILNFYGKKSKVCYLGVDTKIYKPIKVKKRYDLLFVGSRNAIDGYDLLHQTVKSIRRNINERILAVEDEWVEDEKEMANIYNKAKVVLCLAHKEPFGLVAIEAMACGVPVIAIKEGGYKETVVNNKTGFLIKRSKSELTKKLLKILSDDKKRKELSSYARRIALRDWSLNKTTKKMERVIEGGIRLYEK